jgi:endoglucanase
MTRSFFLSMIRSFEKYLILCFLLFLFVFCKNEGPSGARMRSNHSVGNLSGAIRNAKKGASIKANGAIIRGDTTSKKLALVFTGDEFGDGGDVIVATLKQQNIHASFFLTGNFYRKEEFKAIIKKLRKNENYLGSHSDKHLLYCDWTKRDSLLVTRKQFMEDILNSYRELKKWEINTGNAHYFLPPYEWYNDSIAIWTNQMGLQLVCFTPGTRSNADYTYPEMGNKYVDSNTIFQSILLYEQRSSVGMNGFILLIHIGTDPRRTDKFYFQLPALIEELKNRGYQFVKIDELLN